MRNAELVGVLERLCQGLELTDSQFELAKARYEAVGRWLAGAEEKLIRTILIYPQGSTAIGTTVKPIGRIEHDVDLVSHVVEPDQIVAVSLVDGSVLEGELRPSSDTPTHLELYRRFPSIGGVVHTHSSYAAAFAQAGLDIPSLGTTHADHFARAVPVSRSLSGAEIAGDYERATGEAIAETLEGLGLDPLAMPAVLVRSYGPFTWGTSALDAAANAEAVELVGTMAFRTLALSRDAAPLDEARRLRHFERKHGPAAYYGQRPNHR
jgi:L-ribulose-5-phosphate 4-epimerase